LRASENPFDAMRSRRPGVGDLLGCGGAAGRSESAHVTELSRKQCAALLHSRAGRGVAARAQAAATASAMRRSNALVAIAQKHEFTGTVRRVSATARFALAGTNCGSAVTISVFNSFGAITRARHPKPW
jgi:hypothetical protein